MSSIYKVWIMGYNEKDRLADMREIAPYMKEISRYPLLSVEEELRLAMLYAKDKDEDARQRFINGNLRLVVSIAKKYVGRAEELLENLTEREKVVIRNRCGFTEDGRVKTLEEIGQIVGVTRERICQIEAQALRKIKRTARRNDLNLFMQ